MRYLSYYLVYAAVLLRALAPDDPPVRQTLIVLLLVFGVLLVTEPFVTRRLRFYPWIYLVAQTALLAAALFTPPTCDYVPTLFLPLSMQAVLFLKPRLGFSLIGLFTLVMTVPLMDIWDWDLAGAVMVILFTGLNLLMGSCARLIQRAEQSRQENQRMLLELQNAYRQLQEYAAQVEELTISQERSHMAQELHDSVTQTIFSMNLTVQTARILAEKDSSQTARQLEHLLELARSSVDEIQVLISHLRPRSLTDEGLAAALRRLAGERQERDGLQIDLEISSDKNLPEAVTVGLYRMVQEALNNIAKHAGTSQAVIRLDLQHQPAFVEIEDRGVGFDPEKTAPAIGHIGLSGMAERARQISWKLLVHSQPGRGTCIRVEEVSQ